MKKVFDPECVFRYGGDEFVVIAEGADDAVMSEAIAKFEEKNDELNRSGKYDGVKLSISKGTAIFVPDEDKDVKSVFVRADDAMYSEKREYYREIGDRRKPRSDSSGPKDE